MDLNEIKRLIQLVQKSGIGELEVSEGERTIRITAAPSVAPALAYAAAPAQSAPAPAPVPAAAPQAAAPNRRCAPVTVVSPMVGTFYRAPAPDADPYVELNSQVDLGQTVCIVEAMKLMNEIESEVRGRIVRILVDNGQPVEYGQSLFLVDPS
jgi:acetyl-CoA carboxylase biotin carboxyl carrier protein